MFAYQLLYITQLWNHGKLEVAEIAEDSELAVRLEMDPPVPPVELNQVL